MDVKSWIQLYLPGSALLTAGIATVLAGCGGSDPPAPVLAQAAPLSCDDSMKTAFKPDAQTSVLLVKSFKKGDPLVLSAAPASPPPTALEDLCLVKLNVGPGNPGPASAPSTSAGVGIEVWMPTPAKWTQRIYSQSDGGWGGGIEGDITRINFLDFRNSPVIAATQGMIVSQSDMGHPSEDPFSDPSFTMNPDGSFNTVLLKDFASASLHKQAVAVKALAQAYYGKPHKYAYFEDASNGGRAAYALAQNYPEDYDGIAAGAPAVNWTNVLSSDFYPQLVIQRDLGGVGPTPAQDALVSGSAISACDAVGGQHLGYVLDPASCRYDPTKDASVLCAGTTSNGVVGTNATEACVSPALARAFNKIWFGPTADGTAPDPAANNGFNASLTDDQLWYGVSRGTTLYPYTAGPAPFGLATDTVALALQDPKLGSPSFKNATGNGINGALKLSYSALANAMYQGIALQPYLGNINTDNPDLSGLKKTKAKVLHWHGTNDQVIPVQGSINYYTRVANLDGGFDKTQQYNRLFLVPGMGHVFGVGQPSGVAGPAATPNSVPLLYQGPADSYAGQIFSALKDWVENGTAPSSITVKSADASASQLLCPYPQKATYKGTGAINSAASYTCK